MSIKSLNRSVRIDSLNNKIVKHQPRNRKKNRIDLAGLYVYVKDSNGLCHSQNQSHQTIITWLGVYVCVHLANLDNFQFFFLFSFKFPIPIPIMYTLMVFNPELMTIFFYFKQERHNIEHTLHDCCLSHTLNIIHGLNEWVKVSEFWWINIAPLTMCMWNFVWY